MLQKQTISCAKSNLGEVPQVRQQQNKELLIFFDKQKRRSNSLEVRGMVTSALASFTGVCPFSWWSVSSNINQASVIFFCVSFFFFLPFHRKIKSFN